MKRKTKVTVFEAQQYDGNGWPPEEALGALAWLIKQLQLIPVEHQNAAKFEISSTESYGGTYAMISITYERPETDVEEFERLREDQYKADIQREREIKQLAELQAKYGAPK